MHLYFKGQRLRLGEFDGKYVLWLLNPEQRSLPHVKFVGGDPSEYCIFIEDMTIEELMEVKNADGHIVCIPVRKINPVP